MCGVMNIGVAVVLMLLVPLGAWAWLDFIASAKRHAALEDAPEDAVRDDAGLNAFDRAHLRSVLGNKLIHHPDLQLRSLASRARGRLLASALVGGLLMLLLIVRTYSSCAT